MMCAALWFVGLFALAVALALFAGNNQGMVSLFWPPYRVDISLNMALLALLGLFVLCYASLRGVAVLGQLPEQTRRWRQQQKERKLYAALIRSLAHLQAGRFVRASKSARELLEHSNSLRHSNAAVPLDMRASWQPLIEALLEGERPIAVVLVLVDIRRGVGDEELDFIDWLLARNIKSHIVLTKADKLSKSERGTTVAAMKKNGRPGVGTTAFSTLDQFGRDELLSVIFRSVSALRAG